VVVKYLRKAYTNFATYIYDIPPRMLALLLIMIFALLPMTRALDSSTLMMLRDASVMAILAASWDLLVGRTGQMSLGHALFIGIGGYSSALLFMHFGWPVWMVIPVSMLAGAVVALLIGLPCLRVKGSYLALLTLAFPLLLERAVYYFRDVTKAEEGIPPPPRLPAFFQGLIRLDARIAEYYLTLSLMVISAIILYKIANSKRGMVFVSILDDELASKACGINVTNYKLLAFVISGLFASLSGCVAVYISSFANPSFFGIRWSVLPLVVTIFGGIGTIYGPIVGTYIYYFLDMYVFRKIINISEWHYFGLTWEYATFLIFILIVIIFILKWPRGIARAVVEKLEDLEEARPIEELEQKMAKAD